MLRADSAIAISLDLNPGSGLTVTAPQLLPEEHRMTDRIPIACSLSATDLQTRLDEIAAVGTASLIRHDFDGERYRLRFRRDPETRRRLEAIVAAEAECCSFLDLRLAEENGELVLLIAAPQGGHLVAKQLAAAFALR
jgi:hypothetical protein